MLRVEKVEKGRIVPIRPGPQGSKRSKAYRASTFDPDFDLQGEESWKGGISTRRGERHTYRQLRRGTPAACKEQPESESTDPSTGVPSGVRDAEKCAYVASG